MTPAARTPTKWTDDQLRAIGLDGMSLLVSAAAGSGKTAVLAARCVRLVDGPEIGPHVEDGLFAAPRPEVDPCSVEHLLVLTFTNTAARQMRDRIAQRLRERLERHDSAGHKAAAGRLRRELALLPRAAISTLSSFCSSVLRRHFHAARIDPGFTVLDEDQSRLLKGRVARELFDEAYEQTDSTAFRRLVDLYADGFDQQLIDRVIACHAFLASVADPQRWMKESLSAVREAAERPLAESVLGNRFLALVREDFSALERLAESVQQTVQALAGSKLILKRVAGYTAQLGDQVCRWRTLADSSELTALANETKEFDPGRKPPVPSRFLEKEPVDRAVKELRDAMTKGEAVSLAAFTEKQWQEGLRSVVEPAEQFLQLVQEFGDRYDAQKSAIRSLDFADLERKTLNLLLAPGTGPEAMAPSDIARHYQVQFRHVLVDEFQDINEVQDRLLRLLSGETAPPEDTTSANNLFCVGDVKQSIYRFRLAEPRQFLDRQKRIRKGLLSPARVIDLQQNFRSRQPLLEAINAAFCRLMSDGERLEIDYADRHELNADPAYRSVPDRGFKGGPVEIHVLEAIDSAGPGTGDAEEGEARDSEEAEAERIEREAAVIAERIRQFMDEGRVILNDRGEPEPFDFRHVAVLMRSLRMQSERFARVLRRRGVPCHSEVGTGFFASLEVRDILSLLHLLDNRRQDIPLAAVLRSPLVDLPEAAEILARIRAAHPGAAVPFHEAVARYAGRHLEDGVAARLRYVLERLEDYRRLAHRRPLAELIWHVYLDSGYLSYVAGLHDGEQRVANLLELHRRAGQFDTFSRQGLGAFVEFLRTLDESGEVGQPPVVSEADNVVRVMSVHASKGLEFPVVFLADCGKQHNLSSANGSILLEREVGVAMQAVDELRQVRYPTLAHEIARRRIRRADVAEELRVLYVAMTRAREHLVCVGTLKQRGNQGADATLDRWNRFAPQPRFAATDVLRGDSFLTWLGMAAAGLPEHFEVRVVDSQMVEQLVRGATGRSKPPPLDPALCDLEPLSNAPPLQGPAKAAIDRVVTPYAFAPFTKLRAAVGVTTVTKRDGGNLPPTRPGSLAVRAARATQLPRPACLEDAFQPIATDIGTATHTVLRHLDFRSAATEAELRRQVNDMVQRRQLDHRMVAHVDIAAVHWLAGTDLGVLLREHHDHLLRELPIRLGVEPELADPAWSQSEVPRPMTEDPADRVLLRGQIDVVIPLGSGLVVADYKTDRIAAGNELAVAAAVDAYGPQLSLYRRGLERVSNRAVTATYLVLLGARHLQRL